MEIVWWLSLLMYALCSAYWLYSFVVVVARMRFFINPDDASVARFFRRVTKAFNFLNALVTVVVRGLFSSDAV
jgi:hypothetical protein